MVKWGLNNNKEDNKCECGKRQMDEYLLVCAMNPAQCTRDDLIQANKNTVDVATHLLQYGILSLKL